MHFCSRPWNNSAAAPQTPAAAPQTPAAAPENPAAAPENPAAAPENPAAAPENPAAAPENPAAAPQTPAAAPDIPPYCTNFLGVGGVGTFPILSRRLCTTMLEHDGPLKRDDKKERS